MSLNPSRFVFTKEWEAGVGDESKLIQGSGMSYVMIWLSIPIIAINRTFDQFYMQTSCQNE